MNKLYKVFFWSFHAVIIFCISGNFIFPGTGDLQGLLYAMILLYIGAPLWILFFVLSVVFLIKKKFGPSEKRLFIIFCISNLVVIFLPFLLAISLNFFKP